MYRYITVKNNLAHVLIFAGFMTSGICSKICMRYMYPITSTIDMSMGFVTRLVFLNRLFSTCIIQSQCLLGTFFHYFMVDCSLSFRENTQKPWIRTGTAGTSVAGIATWAWLDTVTSWETNIPSASSAMRTCSPTSVRSANSPLELTLR